MKSMLMLFAPILLFTGVVLHAEEAVKPTALPPAAATSTVSPTQIPPLPQPQIDPNKVISLTIGELNALLAAERDNAAAAGVVKKIQEQVGMGVKK